MSILLYEKNVLIEYCCNVSRDELLKEVNNNQETYELHKQFIHLGVVFWYTVIFNFDVKMNCMSKKKQLC